MTDREDETAQRPTRGLNDAERESQVDRIIERIERLARVAKERALALAARLRRNNPN